jgi:hypothetical protein
MPSPTTHNAILTNYFQFQLEKVPNIVYFCQAINLPGIRKGEFEQPTILSHPIRSPVGAIRFDDLTIAFKVDENLNNWREIHSWMKEMSHYTDDRTTIRPWDQQRTNARLLITSSSYRPKIKVEFRKIFPIELSGINFNSVSPESVEAVATAKFAYSDYDIEVLANP